VNPSRWAGLPHGQSAFFAELNALSILRKTEGIGREFLMGAQF
jgi:hypothetical protein